jgi:hypothetical protein
LENIASFTESWQREGDSPPSRQAITAAKQLVHSLPDSIADVSVGINGDGNAYFKLRNGEKLAYLTVEPAIMHLLVMTPEEKNVYLDDVRFHPRVLPSKILRTLEQKMAG